jgi:hypothetical protein
MCKGCPYTRRSFNNMDVIIEKNIFSTIGGDLKVKHSAQITERSITDLAVR